VSIIPEQPISHHENEKGQERLKEEKERNASMLNHKIHVGETIPEHATVLANEVESKTVGC